MPASICENDRQMSLKDPELEAFVRALPKAELHLHIEGSLEPEMVFDLAHKHGIALKYPTVEALRAAYDFHDLQSFLDIYYACADVLRDEEDFYLMTRAYLRRAHADGVVHAEMFFDPQTHTARGIPMSTVINGMDRAMLEAEREFCLTTRLIMCFLRHLSEADAMLTYEQALPFRHRIAAVGLDSSEAGNPPAQFARVFARARRRLSRRCPCRRGRSARVHLWGDGCAACGAHRSRRAL